MIPFQAQAVFSLGLQDEIIRIVGDSYEGIEWKNEPKVSKEVMEAEIKRLQDEYQSKEYQRLREREYPDFREYLDGIVKGDNGQIQAYIDSCLRVKEKYPKP